MILPEGVSWFCEQIFYVVRLIMILGFVLTFCWVLFLRPVLHFKNERKKGRTFKQICKEDVFVFNGEANEMHRPNHNFPIHDHNSSSAFCSTDLNSQLARRYSYHFSFLTENIHHD